MYARPFDWTDLEIFLATARGGSLAAAAAVLRLDASTVQRRVGKLEAALATRLFDRSPRGYALTVAGGELFTHTVAMEEELLAARRKVGAGDGVLAGTVRVTTVDDLAVTILPPILRSFRERHPRVMLALDVRSGFADLARQQADVAVRIGIGAPRGDVVVRPVARVAVGLYGSRAYFAKHRRPRTLDDLREHAIVRGAESMAGISLEVFTDRYVDASKIAFRSESFLARLAAIKSGMGVGFLGRFMGDRDADLERVALPLPDFGATLGLVVHTDVRRNVRARAFVEHVSEALGAERARFEGGEGLGEGMREAKARGAARRGKGARARA